MVQRTGCVSNRSTHQKGVHYRNTTKAHRTPLIDHHKHSYNDREIDILSLFFASRCHSQQLDVITVAGKIYVRPVEASQVTLPTSSTSRVYATPTTAVPNVVVSQSDLTAAASSSSAVSQPSDASLCPYWDMLPWVPLTSDQRNVPSVLEPGAQSPFRLRGSTVVFLIWCKTNIPIRSGANYQIKDLLITNIPESLKQCMDRCTVWNQPFPYLRCVAVSLDANSVCYLKGYETDGGNSLVGPEGGGPPQITVTFE